MTNVPFASCSYQGQDLFVIEALGGLRGGYFLDSGASDGASGSNTLLLESHFGWSGICVEPNAALFARLVRSRHCICVNCCLYDEPGDVRFLEAAGVLGGIISEYHPDLLQQARDLVATEHGPGSESTVVKPAVTVRTVLREHAAPNIIDYWSLDTEGSELALLKSFPFDEYLVRVLTVEHNFTSRRSQIRRLLEGRGYRLHRELGIDDAYVYVGAPRHQAWRSAVWSRSARL